MKKYDYCTNKYTTIINKPTIYSIVGVYIIIERLTQWQMKYKKIHFYAHTMDALSIYSQHSFFCVFTTI